MTKQEKMETLLAGVQTKFYYFRDNNSFPILTYCIVKTPDGRFFRGMAKTISSKKVSRYIANGLAKKRLYHSGFVVPTQYETFLFSKKPRTRLVKILRKIWKNVCRIVSPHLSITIN